MNLFHGPYTTIPAAGIKREDQKDLYVGLFLTTPLRPISTTEIKGGTKNAKGLEGCCSPIGKNYLKEESIIMKIIFGRKI